MILIYEETFEEYTERRISTANKLKDFFPEHFSIENFNYLRAAYGFKDHYTELKLKLEQLFGCVFTWEAFDDIYQRLGFLTSLNFVDSLSIEYLDSIQSIEDYINFLIEKRKRLYSFLNLEFDEKLEKSFREVFYSDLSSRMVNWKTQIADIILAKLSKEIK